MQTCGRCGQPIPPDAPAGACPHCLLQLAGSPPDQADLLLAGDFLARTRRFGDYILGRQIGAGGMGVVYEAIQVSTQREVAVKVLRDSQCASPVLLCRFTLETEAAARLEHPNIVRVHEVGEFNGHPFFSMDLVSGQALGAAIAARQFPFNWRARSASTPPGAHASSAENRARLETIVSLMVKIARALHHAHERGVLHRDLKPANILIDANGEPHLTDFGLAKILQSGLEAPRPVLTTDANLPGTPNYMSPEQVNSGETSRASDIYGLGAIFYELLTNQPPFSGATPLDIFKQIGEQPPTSPRRRNRAVPAALETICLKCLEKNPAHRYVSAEALAQDLENWLAGRAINARRPTLARNVINWTRRNPVGATLILTLCLGLSIALYLLDVVNHQRNTIFQERNQAFDEGMSEIALLWEEPDKNSVVLSPRKLAILADVPARDLTNAQIKLCFGVATEGSPATVGQWYATILTQLQREMQKELGEPVVFSLKLYKRFNHDELSLARGEVDLMMLTAVDYLKAQALTNGVSPIAREQVVREAVIFAHASANVQSLPELAGKSFAFPDPDLSITVWTKARLAAAGLTLKSLRGFTNIIDCGPEGNSLVPSENHPTVISLLECVNCVLRTNAQANFDASATYRDRFERNKHYGLVRLDSFPEISNVLAARAGLEPRIIDAVQQVIHLLQGRPGFDSASLGLPSAMVPVDDQYFAPLREALQQAERFDGKGVTNQDLTGGN